MCSTCWEQWDLWEGQPVKMQSPVHPSNMMAANKQKKPHFWSQSVSLIWVHAMCMCFNSCLCSSNIFLTKKRYRFAHGMHIRPFLFPSHCSAMITGMAWTNWGLSSLDTKAKLLFENAWFILSHFAHDLAHPWRLKQYQKKWRLTHTVSPSHRLRSSSYFLWRNITCFASCRPPTSSLWNQKHFLGSNQWPL